ncbi:hypothetical protein niasHT_004377 [Heterodera trifolii]|uniref:Uncharacterized protein n=1 Tax=Heterodera trifolii TaxID=157864 RepID=A0ABD2M3X6_9BILA
MLHHKCPSSVSVFIRHAISGGKSTKWHQQQMPFVSHAVHTQQQQLAQNDAVGLSMASAEPAALAADDSDGTNVFVRMPSQRHHQQHRLTDPAEQLNQVRINLKILLHNEYLETRDLAKIVSWADEIRQKGINNTPLIDLIERITQSKEDAETKRQLTYPIYKAFLLSPESKSFVDRPVFYFPAVAHLFKASNTPEFLHNAQSFWSQFGCTPAECVRNMSPDQHDDLCRFFRVKFDEFIHELSVSEFQRTLPHLATAIRQNGLFLRAPLAAAVDRVSAQPNKWRIAYAAFVANAAERQQFAGRLHIYFPWMIKMLRDVGGRRSETRLGIVLCLIRRIGGGGGGTAGTKSRHFSSAGADVPPFLLQLLQLSLPEAFSCACATNNFVAANQIWRFGGSLVAEEPPRPQPNNVRGRHRLQPHALFPTNFRFRDVLLFAMHLWTTGGGQQQYQAQHMMHFYVDRAINDTGHRSKNNNYRSGDGGGAKTNYVHAILNELSELNVTYRHNLTKATTNAERKKFHHDFVQAVRRCAS